MTVNWRIWGDRPRRVNIGIVFLFFIAMIGLTVWGMWLLIEPGTPDRFNRFQLVYTWFFLLQRLSKNSNLQPGRTKQTIDVCISLALGFCTVWYVLTGSPTPFGVPAIVWYGGAWIASWAVASLVERANKPLERAHKPRIRSTY
jgi:ABC-type amino acid transport system permease subunit